MEDIINRMIDTDKSTEMKRRKQTAETEKF